MVAVAEVGEVMVVAVVVAAVVRVVEIATDSRDLYWFDPAEDLLPPLFYCRQNSKLSMVVHCEDLFWISCRCWFLKQDSDPPTSRH